ncbi:hypothetical protein DVA86_19105 [Streptomyces armeniacus]|uniref:Uncharacterized protein n=1 Tax=Streptomyces armeniacus TaxID=83291 RepID=A0A345Y0Q1_9ACTN|nr:hypothetical protein [Streptomyces armeniacus]AXK37467.1 hypothetical protein DVA86_19105 [Streptomyces armeniacus]
MPLRMSPAPAPALRSLLDALGSPAAGITGAPRPDLPLPIHEIARVGQRQGPPSTRLTGWRFLLRDRPPGAADGAGDAQAVVVGAAEVMMSAEGWSFAHFREGPYVSSTERAMEQAGALPLPYQPRLLSVPELYMLTLWLHGDADADPAEGSPAASDLLIPLAPAPPGIAAHQPHRVDALLPLLTHRLVASSSPLLGTAV